MTTKRITALLLILCCSLLVIWDVFVAWNPLPGDTISEMVLAFVMKNPTVSFFVGVVCGHLFWPQYPNLKD